MLITSKEQFEQNFKVGDIIVITLVGYNKPIICKYNAVLQGISDAIRVQSEYGINAVNEFGVNTIYGIRHNDVRLATLTERNRLVYWINTLHKCPSEIKAQYCLVHKVATFDSVGFIRHVSVDYKTDASFFHILYVGLYDDGVKVYATEVNSNGEDYNQQFFNWKSLPEEIQKKLLGILEKPIGVKNKTNVW